MNKFEEALIGYSHVGMDEFMSVWGIATWVVILIVLTILTVVNSLDKGKLTFNVKFPEGSDAPILILFVLIGFGVANVYDTPEEDYLDMLKGGIGPDGLRVEDFNKVEEHKIDGNLMEIGNFGAGYEMVEADKVIEGCKIPYYMEMTDGKFILCVSEEG